MTAKTIVDILRAHNLTAQHTEDQGYRQNTLEPIRRRLGTPPRYPYTRRQNREAHGRHQKSGEEMKTQPLPGARIKRRKTKEFGTVETMPPMKICKSWYHWVSENPPHC